MVDPRIADVVNAAHLRLKDILPEQRWCLLLTGSWAAGEDAPMSDIDLELIWIPSSQNEGILERRAIQAAREDIERMSAGRVDFGDVTFHDLSQKWRAWWVPRLLSPSVLIGGVDLRPQLPRPSIDEYRRSVAYRAKEMIARIRGQKPHTLTLPLTLPDSHMTYYGYEIPRTWYPPDMTAGSREVYDLVAALATALYVKTSGVVVTSKRQGLDGFVSSADEWSSFVADVRDTVQRLNYRLPDHAEGREHLRQICKALPAFEAYMLGQLHDELQ